MLFHVDIHSIFGGLRGRSAAGGGAVGDSSSSSDAHTTTKLTCERERLVREKEERREEAEAAFRVWLERKKDERRRARSSVGDREVRLSGTLFETISNNLTVVPQSGPIQAEAERMRKEERERKMAESQAAFQWWLDRKRLDDKQNCQLKASLSQQVEIIPVHGRVLCS